MSGYGNEGCDGVKADEQTRIWESWQGEASSRRKVVQVGPCSANSGSKKSFRDPMQCRASIRNMDNLGDLEASSVFVLQRGRVSVFKERRCAKLAKRKKCTQQGGKGKSNLLQRRVGRRKPEKGSLLRSEKTNRWICVKLLMEFDRQDPILLAVCRLG
ncbi:hypothetical protein CVT26_001525 [Gymnopilus dilepis]|uniref:Uncharacterized protein n=1 Tax=Gymnopilus dilepis TaxID=231916 RepID=A0A409WB22_9AGAR|nr:hypothetical protein CVT26_001525 [Gymnopilus dilepis]